ncbi:MAG: DegT/DnrJ/EryC1/StrS aminotransferase family protein [Chloroflexi bacterium]|nr:DegT/DnrJ/EryC1/StrS aminotransferase family protein [Chloroflexota bacterium]MBU1750604.1 DegT/DnrJ/EryC1/StrS aminotransferase family protein [Chloroflexota bacterium]MBU1877974.1 DegT/DnrJ/EryC1/StrS aminotransferase family protein [Chloroflexota bacterium]
MNEKLAIDGGTPVRDKFLVFGTPTLGDEEIAEVVDTLRSGWIGMGPKVARFEEQFRDYIGCSHAVAVSSCTAGLHLCLVVHNIGPGDEVITSPLTFVATANVILHQGARPIFVDIDPHTLNIDPNRIEAAITPRTRAIIPVHFGGLSCDMDAIMDVARRHNLIVIEDAAHAVGTRYHGQLVGATPGSLASFSFYANKNITTAEGGMITTEDPVAAGKLLVYRQHGMDRDAWQRFQVRQKDFCDFVAPGYKYNLTDLQASLGIHQLRKLPSFQDAREQLAAQYDAAFDELSSVQRQFRPTSAGDRHALHLYVLIVDTDQLTAPRNKVIMALRAENIGATLHYTAVHLLDYYQHLGYRRGDCPVAEHVSEHILSLPLVPTMTPSDADDVISAVRKVLTAYKR